MNCSEFLAQILQYWKKNSKFVIQNISFAMGQALDNDNEWSANI